MMLSNGRRMAAFRHAIARTVRPGDRVIEAGTGSGILSALAVRAGAEHVWALERDPEMAAVARRTMQLNGLSERVSVVEGPAEAFDCPERPDVVICEMLHVGLVNEQQVPVMRALLARHGHPGLRIIPHAAVSALQLMAVDDHYEGFRIPLIRSSHPYVEDPRLAAVSEPVTYWVCLMQEAAPEIDVCVPLEAACDATVNAVSLITKAVMTEAFDHPDNDWYLFQLQLPLPPREVQAGESVTVHLSYRAGAPLEAIRLGWASPTRGAAPPPSPQADGPAGDAPAPKSLRC